MRIELDPHPAIGAQPAWSPAERRLVPIIARMEQDGIAIDAAELARMSADFGARMAGFPYELPLGLFATLLGAPWLLFLLMRTTR